MRIKKLLVITLISTCLGSQVRAEEGAFIRAAAAPHSVRDAVARQHQPLQQISTAARTLKASHRNPAATKVTAAVALGCAGVLAGMVTAYGIANATNNPGSNQGTMWAGAIIGGGAGAALGVWLASR